jgi:hypothetical protein
MRRGTKEQEQPKLLLYPPFQINSPVLSAMYKTEDVSSNSKGKSNKFKKKKNNKRKRKTEEQEQPKLLLYPPFQINIPVLSMIYKTVKGWHWVGKSSICK